MEPYDLRDLEPDHVVKLAARIARENAQRKQAARIEAALETLQTSANSPTLSPTTREAIRTLSESRPTAWLEFAVKRRLAEEGL